MNTPQSQKKVQEKVLQYQQRAFNILSECGIEQPQKIVNLVDVDFENKSRDTSATSQSISPCKSESDATKIQENLENIQMASNINLVQQTEPTEAQQILKVSKLLGDGHQAKVYLASNGDFKGSQCVKVFEQFKTKEMLAQADTEFRVTQQLKGEASIVQVHSFERQTAIIIDGELQQDKYYFNMEYCENGDMYDFMSGYNDKYGQGLLTNDSELLKSLFLELINSLSLVHHKAEYAHLDLKLENILVSGDGQMKLCDFGFAQKAENKVTQCLGTRIYMAPEIHTARQQPCLGTTADIFSLGVIFFTLAFGAPPFNQTTRGDTFFKYLHAKPDGAGFFKLHPHTKKLHRAGLIDQNLQNLLANMLCTDPAKRIQNVNDLKSFDYLSGIDSGNNKIQLLQKLNEIKSQKI